MAGSLNDVLKTLRNHQEDLRRIGVAHAAVFGSVARGEATDASDIDVMVELDEQRPMGIFTPGSRSTSTRSLAGPAMW